MPHVRDEDVQNRGFELKSRRPHTSRRFTAGFFLGCRLRARRAQSATVSRYEVQQLDR